MSFQVKKEAPFGKLRTGKKVDVSDSIGNREQSSRNSETNDYTANNLNQYSSINGTNLTYDADGNMLTNGEWTYAWNGENRLVSASNGATVVSFKYDYRGRRFSKTVDGDETLFIYDGWNMVRESSSVGTNHYVWGLDLSQSLQGAGGVGGLLSVTESDGETYFSVADANGNVMGYIDDAGNVEAVYTYDAFGRIIAASGAKVDDFKYSFSTKYLDETGLSYYGRRYYAPEMGMGRFINRDPLGEEGGVNLYAFVRNDPVGKIDLYGYLAVSFVKDGAICSKQGDPQGLYLALSALPQSAEAKTANYMVSAIRVRGSQTDCQGNQVGGVDEGPLFLYDSLSNRWPFEGNPTQRLLIVLINSHRNPRDEGGVPVMDDFLTKQGINCCSKGKITAAWAYQLFKGPKPDGFSFPTTWNAVGIDQDDFWDNQKSHSNWSESTPDIWNTRGVKAAKYTCTIEWDYCKGNNKFTTTCEPNVPEGPNRLNRP